MASNNTQFVYVTGEEGVGAYVETASLLALRISWRYSLILCWHHGQIWNGTWNSRRVDKDTSVSNGVYLVKTFMAILRDREKI